MKRDDSRYRILFEFANDCHFLLKDGRFIEVNRRAEQIFGGSAEELLGLNPWEMSPEFQADGQTSEEKGNAMLDRALAGEPQVFEWIHLRHDGSPFPTEVSLTRLDLDHGPAVFAVVRDLTEQQETQEALRQSEEQLHLIADLIPARVARLDADLRLTFANRGYQELVGLPESELLGSHIRDVVGAEFFLELAPHLDRVLQGFPARVETTRATDGLGARILAAQYRPDFSSDGTVRGIVAMILDVTDEREAEAKLTKSEAKFRTLFDSSPIAVVNTTFEGEILSCNAAFTRMHRTADGPVAQVGRNVAEFFPEGTKEVVFDRIRQAIGSPERAQPEIFSMLREDGEPFPAEAISSPIRDENGDPVSMVAHAIDITERLATEAAEKRAREDLRALSRRLEEIREEERASISRELHDELGGALTTLLMDMGALKRNLGTDRPDLSAEIEAMEGAILDNLGIVKDLSARLRPPILDVLGLGPALQWQAEEISRRAPFSVHIQVPQEKSDLSQAISTASFRIAQEALTNIIRHAEATEVSLTLETTGNELSLEIQDNGVGIDFGSSDGPPSLGLVGMRERALALDGVLTVERGPSGGTRIHLAVPLPSAEDSDPAS